MKIIVAENFVQKPFVSVVVPSYNRANTVSQTLDSILNQQCDFDFEIIIGDDCSTDNARGILLNYQTKYPEKIKLLFYDENIGLGANWATCIKHCNGKYIANCDNDDYWHNPQKLQLQINFMEENPQYGLCHTDYRTHNRKTGKIREYVGEIGGEGNEEIQAQSIMYHRFSCCNASVMYHKSVLLQYINLDDYINFHFSLQDWNTWMLIAPFTKFRCLHISTATFGIETQSITRPQNIDKMNEKWKKQKACYQYICKKLPQVYPYNENEYDQLEYASCLDYAYAKMDYRIAKKYALLLNNKSLRVRFAKNRFLFYLYALAGKLRIMIILKAPNEYYR